MIRFLLPIFLCLFFLNACNEAEPDCVVAQKEIPYNGIDDDCNEATPDDDLDYDGYSLAEDCDDNDPSLNPGIFEQPFNGRDDDCDPTTLDNDNDQDGYSVDDDCNDNDPLINPGRKEKYYNGIDDDCNPDTYDDDVDKDGYTRDEDCDDFDPMVNPGILDSDDYDCNNKINRSELQTKICDCGPHVILDTEEIKQNIIGKWELLAFTSSWQRGIWHACIRLEISTDSIYIDNIDTGEKATISYDVKETVLIPHDENWERKVGMNYYCKNLIFGYGGWIDGDTYYYQRL